METAEFHVRNVFLSEAIVLARTHNRRSLGAEYQGTWAVVCLDLRRPFHNLESARIEEYVTQNEIGHDTQRSYHYHVNAYEKWLGRVATLADFTDDNMNRFMRDLVEAGNRPATVGSRKKSLLAFWRCAYMQEILEYPPRRIRRIRNSSQPVTAWTFTETARLLDHCHVIPFHYRHTGIKQSAFWDSYIRVAWEYGPASQ